MTVQLYANNAKTTLASPINATQTTITVAPGTGALFPNPSSGQGFKITLVSAASSSVYEICLCTARSTDTLTVVRAQEGTSGTPFLLSDIVGNFDTAGVMNNLIQTPQLQSNYYTYADAGGSANALTATVPSSLTALSDGMSFIINTAYANTGASTLNLTLGSTATGALPIVSGGNLPILSGYIPGAGYQISVIYSQSYNAWVLLNPSLSLSAYALINSQTFTGTPRVPTAPFNDNSTIIASTTWVQGQLANYAPIFSPALTGTPTAPTAANGTSTTQIATTAFVQNNLAIVKGLGFGGTVWNNVTGSRSLGTNYTNSYSYPIMISCFGNGAGASGINIYVNGSLIYQNNAQWNGAGAIPGGTLIIPPGATYQVTMASSLNSWWELY